MGMELYIIQFLSFTIHSFLCMLLVWRIAEKERINKIAIAGVCVLNGILAPSLINSMGSNGLITYLLISTALNLEVFILFKDTTKALVGLTFGLLIHFFACRAVVICVHALYLQQSVFSILTNSEILYENTLYTVWVHIFVLIAFIKFVPPNAVKVIIVNKTLINNIDIMMVAIWAVFVYSVKIFEVNLFSEDFIMQQIVIHVMLLGAFYLMLIFMIKLISINEYKLIIEELEKKIDKNQMLSSAIFSHADILVEVNITQDKIYRVIVNSEEVPVISSPTFTSFLQGKIAKLLHEEDGHVLEKLDPKNIIKNYENGVYEINYEYRTFKVMLDKEDGQLNFDKNKYLWHEARISTKKDEKTGDIISIFTIYDNNEEKEAEIELLEKTERDVLTGAYNKEAVKEKVTKHLENDGAGALFIFDIDNFKGINDNFGHAYGDIILAEVYDAINLMFRENDIVGRFGGDEFVAFIKGEVSVDEIEKIANRICSSVEKIYKSASGIEIKVSASVGVAIAPKNASNYEDLFNCADKALYISKENGKNMFTIYGQ